MIGLGRDFAFRGMALMVVPWLLLLGVLIGAVSAIVALTPTSVGEGVDGRGWIIPAVALAVSGGAAFKVGLPRALGYWVLWTLAWVFGMFLALAAVSVGGGDFS